MSYMKKIIKHMLLLILIILTGCSDKLNVDPHTFASDKTYYKTEEQIGSAVNGIYNVLQSLYNSSGNNAIYTLTEMRSDNTDFQYFETDRGVQQREDINDFLMTASNIYNQDVWNTLYRGIQQANAVIDNIGNVEFSTPEKGTQYEGEAKFIRAFLYFHLVRLYGEVPLRDKHTSGPGDAFTAQKASVDELYTFMKGDVNFAIENLPVKYDNDADKGRLTKGAAYTLMGEIHLTLHDYQNAVAALTEVTKLGYDLVRGEDAYARVFDTQNKNNIESIFEIQFSASLDGENSSYIFSFAPRDSRAALINPAWTGAMAGTNTPTLDMLLAYEPGDLRKEASIDFFVDPANRVYQESFGGNLSIGGDSAVYIKKYYHPPYTINGRADENFPVYRYAYVKLILAEALNEIGKGSEALPLLNDVRKRAGLDEITNSDQAFLREAIFKEIRVEVAFENHRWYQLLRTGRAIEIMTEHGKKEKERLREAARKLGQVCHLIDAAYDIKPYKLLFPIPERECRLNGFPNNDGWS